MRRLRCTINQRIADTAVHASQKRHGFFLQERMWTKQLKTRIRFPKNRHGYSPVPWATSSHFKIGDSTFLTEGSLFAVKTTSNFFESLNRVPISIDQF